MGFFDRLIGREGNESSEILDDNYRAARDALMNDVSATLFKGGDVISDVPYFVFGYPEETVELLARLRSHDEDHYQQFLASLEFRTELSVEDKKRFRKNLDRFVSGKLKYHADVERSEAAKKAKEAKRELVEYARSVGIEPKSLEKAVAPYVFLRQRTALEKRIASLPDEKKDTTQSFFKAKQELERSYREGEISIREYYRQIDKLYAKTVKSANDKELTLYYGFVKKESRAYYVATGFYSDSGSRDEPKGKVVLRDEDDAEKFDKSKVDFEADLAKILGPSFSVENGFYKAKLSDECVFSLTLSYDHESGISFSLHNEERGEQVYRSRDALVYALGENLLFNSFRNRLYENIGDSDSFDKLNEENFMFLAVSLTNYQQERFLSLDSESKLVLENLAKMLAKDSPDDRYAALADRVNLLSAYLKLDAANVLSLRKRLLANDIPELGDLLEL